MLNYINNDPYIEGVPLNEVTKIHATPFYIYSHQIISEKYKELKESLNSEIFYSIKANSNLAIIKLIKSFGAGADVVSVGELKRALAAGVNPKKIIFEGLGKTKEDIIFAINENIRLINIESFDEIKRINLIANSLNKKINIGIRLNPNIDGKMINQISTGKKTDKFGISIENINEIINIINNSENLNLIGLSCHIGSQISDIEIFKNIFKLMKKSADKFINNNISIKHLDLGGGFGIKYNDELEINLNDLKKIVESSFKNTTYSLSFEPGRYLVAKAGIIITKIIETKYNGGINFLITDAGMHTFIRPSLYGARHAIKSINSSSSDKINYTVAGPICESSDIISKNILLPKQIIGNHLVICDAGAYGSVMSSNYNSRGLPAEILVKGSSFSLIRKKENIEETIKKDLIPTWLKD